MDVGDGRNAIDTGEPQSGGYLSMKDILLMGLVLVAIFLMMYCLGWKTK